MNSYPLISVIIPVYNAEKTIESCVKSITCQDYPYFEIILIDDGSKDSSPAICDVLSGTHKNVHTYHFENAGAAEARNRGILKATGEFIAFIDSDDLVLPDYLSYLYSLIKKYNADISVCSYSKLFANKNTYKTGIIKPDIYSTKETEDYQVPFKKSVAVERLLYQRNFISSPWAMLSKKSLWNNVKFPAGKRAEDMATIYKLFFEADIVAYGSKKLYLYILRKSNTVFSTSSLLNPDYYRHCLNMVEFIRKNLPDALPAAKSRLFSACFQILSETPANEKNQVLVSEIYETISDIRKDILKDSKGKPRNRIAALISIISIPLLHTLLRIYYIAICRFRL